MTDFLTDGWDLDADDTTKCNIYSNYRKSGKFFGADNINGYEGIPQNLVLNVSGWIVS